MLPKQCLDTSKKKRQCVREGSFSLSDVFLQHVKSAHLVNMTTSQFFCIIICNECIAQCIFNVLQPIDTQFHLFGLKQ